MKSTMKKSIFLFDKAVASAVETIPLNKLKLEDSVCLFPLRAGDAAGRTGSWGAHLNEPVTWSVALRQIVSNCSSGTGELIHGHELRLLNLSTAH